MADNENAKTWHRTRCVWECRKCDRYGTGCGCRLVTVFHDDDTVDAPESPYFCNAKWGLKERHEIPAEE